MYARLMRVRVLLFGLLKDRMGASEREVELAERATVADVTAWAMGLLRDDGLVRSIAVAVNREYARPETRLQDGDEVALLPPVSGGSGAWGVRARHLCDLKARPH